MDHLQRVQQEFTRQASQFASAAAVTHRDLVQRFVAAPKNKRTSSKLHHPRESGDPGGLGPRFRWDDVECCLNAN
jgi:hypothetical protein